MIQLKVFPNTGHQYFEVDLKNLLPKKDEDWLERFVWSNRGSWRSWDDYTSWIRYQYAMTDGVACLKLAIETNLGLASRGLLFDLEDNLYEERKANTTGANLIASGRVPTTTTTGCSSLIG